MGNFQGTTAAQQKESSDEGLVIVGSRWKLLSFLGSGGFGSVYLAEDIKTKDIVAVKVFRAKNDPSDMLQELVSYRMIHSAGPVFGIPLVFYYQLLPNSDSCMVMERLGASLEDYLRQQKSGNFPIPTVMAIGLQMVDRLEAVHSQGLLHGDIKPQNILLGYHDPTVAYLVDFGLARGYLESNGMHATDEVSEAGFPGTLEFLSRRVHQQKKPGRKDDLESLVYTLVSLANGELPWERYLTGDDSGSCSLDASMRTGSDDSLWSLKTVLVFELKEKLGLTGLCKDLPPALRAFGRYVERLGFSEKPDYMYMKYLLERGLELMQIGEEEAMLLLVNSV